MQTFYLAFFILQVLLDRQENLLRLFENDWLVVFLDSVHPLLFYSVCVCVCVCVCVGGWVGGWVGVGVCLGVGVCVGGGGLQFLHKK